MSGTTRLLAALTAFGLAAILLPPSARAAACPAAAAQILTIEKTMAAAQTMAELAPYIDQNIVFDDLVPGRMTGAKAYAADVAEQFSKLKNPQVTIMRMHVEADEHLAYAYSIQHFTATTTANQPIAMTFRQVDCYQKVGGKWLLVYQHASVPFDPQTGKAVLDSAP